MEDWQGIDELIFHGQAIHALMAIKERQDVPLRIALELYDERWQWLRQTQPERFTNPPHADGRGVWT